MNAVAIADTIAFVAYAGAFALVALTPSRVHGIGRSLKYLLLAAFGLLLFVGASNFLEHSGITSALDPYEDYAEVLFVPLVAYIVYSRSTVEQLRSAESAERATRREHELLMSVVETTPAGILVADATGRVSFANDEARCIIEWLGAAQPVEADDSEVRRLDLGAVAAAAPVFGERYAIEHDDKRWWFSVRATPLTDEQGREQAVVVLEDVTERVITEHELEQYRRDLERLVDRRTGELLSVNRELEDANAARQRFLANMSHELRTPLNVIIGFTDLLLRELPGPLNPEQHTQLGLVKESSTQLLGLVDGVLDLARIEAGHGAVALAPCDLGATVRAIIAPMSAVADARGVELVCGCPDGPEVVSDADKLGQIVRNLVSNAIKFTDPGGSVSVAVRADAEAATITVADTGIGIAPEHHDRIFEAFQQIETPERARQQGTGLGLAICRELCDLLGYELGLESEVGRGSTFAVSVPLDAAGTHHAGAEGA